ncbi:MAG: trehalose-phosphatase, partial [Burkholderiales bacterium]
AINGKFGTVDWAPILYQYKSFSTEELIALYAASDIALVTPITDGMNLIAKEYVAAKTTSSGALILSETAGAAKELMDAIIVNPNSTIEMATAISQALEMTESEKMARLHTMQARLARYNVITWGTSFITDLLAMQETQANFLAKFIQPMQIETILEQYKQAASRLLILDYDGTLVPINKNPKLAIPNNNILNILNRLAKNPKNQVIIVSGRNKVELQKWLNLPKLLIVAEHGAWIKKKSKWTMTKSLDPNFKKSLLVILEAFMDKLPGSFIEEKDFSLAWHYRNSHHEKASRLVKELTDTLITLTANTELQILPGKKVVEIKHASVNKGIIEQFITKDNSEFILGIGDDITDEDMFRVIPPHHFSLKVGPGASHARFNVRTQNDVVQILDKLTNY